MFIDQIIEIKRLEVEKVREQADYWKRMIDERLSKGLPAKEGERRSLKEAILHTKNRIGLIAEVKKASPSKGLIRPDFQVKEIAAAYREGGADALSVLTEIPFFHGDPAYLSIARHEAGRAVLRKDFIIDPVQLYESVILGADAILLIVAALPQEQLSHLRRMAKELGLEVLMEVHDERELERAVSLDPELLGINNRDLSTFHTSLETTKRLAPLAPGDLLLISESGIHSREDVDQLIELGVDGILVGEHLMRQKNIAEAVRRLVGVEEIG